MAVQLHELTMVHQLAARYFNRTGLLSASHLAALPVIRSRPDVVLRAEVADGTSVSKLRMAPMQTFSQLSDAMRAKEMSGQGPAIMGYRGPWMGGWSDIAWAMRFDGVAHLVTNVHRLPALLAHLPLPTQTLPPFNTRIDEALRTARSSRKYRAELVWMHFFRRLGVRPYFFRFCSVARFRLGVTTSSREEESAPAVGVAAEEPLVPVAKGRLTVRRVMLHSCS